MEAVRVERPATYREAADAIRGCAEAGRAVRFRGGGTKLGWGAPAGEPGAVLSTERLAGIVAHNAGDLTAVLQAGVRLADAQRTFAEAGQMLALDPPLGEGATVGGVVATADSGPLRHRYRAARDLVVGMTVALSDGSVARSGGTVIKNVAGYDLPKLFAGSFGTLGMILEVAVRLHPVPAQQLTAAGRSGDPAAVQRAALAISHAPLELEALDVSWRGGEGWVLVRCAGAAPAPRAERAVGMLHAEGLDADVVRDDEPLWAEQRARQRSALGVVVRVSGRQTDLAGVLRLADRLGASVVSRAGVGVSWLALPLGPASDLVAAVAAIRQALAPRACTVQDAPGDVRDALDPWGEPNPVALQLMRRVKERFDPAGVCNPGVFVGGL